MVRRALWTFLICSALILAACGGQARDRGVGPCVQLPSGALSCRGLDNTVAPSISGNAVQGSVLTASTGTWNTIPSSYAYQWWECDGSGLNCQRLSGATASTYTLLPGDVGHALEVRVIASLGSRTTSADSSASAAVQATVIADYFVAQSSAGTGDGSSCANAEPVSTLSTSTHWTAGNVIGLCGTITSNITANGSGTSGNPITVYWEPGASISSPDFGGQDAVYMANESYITLNGGTNGSISTTAAGTGLADQGVNEKAIFALPCNNCTIENLTIGPLYSELPTVNLTGNLTSGSSTVTNVSSTVGAYVGLSISDSEGSAAIPNATISAVTSGSCPSACSITMSANATASSTGDAINIADATIDATANNAIEWAGSNDVIENNTIHDCGWCIFSDWDTGNTNDQTFGNNVYNYDHGFISAPHPGVSPSNILVYDNHFHDMANWDAITSGGPGNLPHHHDGFHCFGDLTSKVTYTNFDIYDNRFDGTVGLQGPQTAGLFMEGGSQTGATPCSGPGSTVYMFNNVLTSSDFTTAGDYAGLGSTSGGFWNNTVVGHDNTSMGGRCVGYSYEQTGQTMAFENNISSTCHELMTSAGSPNAAFGAASPDYNVYANSGTSAFNCFGTAYDFSQFSSYQACMATNSSNAPGAEAHSTAVSSASLNLNSDLSLGSGSAAIGAGSNLTSTCSGQPNPGLGALCASYTGPPLNGTAGSNTAGTGRPSSGAWNAGAY